MISKRSAPEYATAQALLLAFAAVTLFAWMNALSKYLTQFYPVTQVVWARYFFAVIICLAVLPVYGMAVFRTRTIGLQCFRAIAILSSSGLFITGLSYLPLPVVESIAFVAPLFVTVLSVPLLKEQVGPRTWAAVCIGFIGCLIIIRPGSAVMQWTALLPLCSALCYSLAQIATRPISRVDPSITTLFYSNIIGALILCVMAPFDWRPPDGQGWGLMVVLGGLGAVSHFLLIHALGLAQASVIQPVTYAQLLWAVLIGYVVFGFFPDGWTLLGGSVVAGSGLYVLYRSRVRGRPASLNAPS